MTRIDPDALATHLEVALTCAPLDTLAALQDVDSQRRRRATFSLARGGGTPRRVLDNVSQAAQGDGRAIGKLRHELKASPHRLDIACQCREQHVGTLLQARNMLLADAEHAERPVGVPRSS